jgi:adenosylhomocysteine nucleosidase
MNYKILAAVFIVLTIIGFSSFAYDQYYVIPSQQSQISNIDTSLVAVAQKLNSLSSELEQINSSLASTSSSIISLNSSVIAENSRLRQIADQLIEAPRIGIISSEAKVTSFYVPLMIDVTSVNISGYIFYLGTMDGKPVVATQSNPREGGTAQTTTIMDTNFNIIASIFTGIAGSRNPNVYVGDVVVAAFTVNKAAVHYHRDYIGPYNVPVALSNGTVVNEYSVPSSYGLVSIASSYTNLGATNISTVTGNSSEQGSIQAKMIIGVDGSANQWTESLNWMEFQNSLYQTDAGENNAYGFASVNQAYGVPFIVVQGISDSPWYPNAYDGALAQQRAAAVAIYIVENFNTNELHMPAAFSQLSPNSNAVMNGYIVANKVFTANSSSIVVTGIQYTAQNGSVITISNMTPINREYNYPTQLP